jgi:hypothetical protein
MLNGRFESVDGLRLSDEFGDVNAQWEEIQGLYQVFKILF